MHSLRIKLLLFTILVVFVASMTILWFSVYQSNKRGKGDIEVIREFEKNRVRNSLKEHVNIIYSLIDAQHRQTLTPGRMESLLEKVKNLTYENGRGYFWIVDANDESKFLIHPALDTLSDSARSQIMGLIRTVNKAVREKGEAYCRVSWPRQPGGTEDTLIEKLCYGRLYRPFNWVIASGRYIDDLNEIIANRIENTREEVRDIIRERIALSAIILLACTIALFYFSRMITRPINSLVKLTEEITTGKKGYSERIAIESHDEIGKLTVSFNRMMEHIEDTLNKLRENGRRYRELVENANSAIIRLDRYGRIVFVNEYTQKLTGFDEKSMLNQNITELVATPAGDPSPLFRVMASESHPYSEEEIMTAGGERKWVAWSNRFIHDESGELKEILCIGSDISVRKKAEELSKIQQQKLIQTDKMATLGTLVTGIAHEINNPNNFIILNAENLSDMWKDIRPILDDYHRQQADYALAGLPYTEMREEIPALIKGIADGARRIMLIVDGLKDFVRQEPQDLNQRVDVRRVFEAACLILANMIKKATDDFRIVCEGEAFAVKGNFQRLEQVAINLLTNACQATQDRTKPIIVFIRSQTGSQQVVITVSDQGVGIPAENMKYIMDPFFTTKRHQGGTGLGLAICYNIINDHGGELKMESIPGTGTRATVILSGDPAAGGFSESTS